MAFCGYLKIDTAVDILLGPFMDDGDGDTADTDATLDVELSKNGQALADSESAAPTHDAAGTVDGYYNCILGTTDTNTLGILTVVVHHADDLPVRQDYQVVTANWFDSMCSTDNLDVNVTATSATALDAVLKGSTFALAMADAIWDEVLTGLTHNENTSAGKRLREVEDTAHIYSGGVASATASTVVLDAGPVATDGYYDHDLIIVIAGTGVGQSRHIDSYTQGDLTFNIKPDWKTNPAADSEVAIRAEGEVDVHGFSANGLGEIEAECVDALESFNLDKLLAVSTGINADADLSSIITDKSVMSHLMTIAADTSTYKASEDSKEALGILNAAVKAVTDDMKMKDTTISSVDTADTKFILTDGLTGNDDINNAVCSIYDVTGNVWSGPRRVVDYIHASKLLEIDANTAFALQASDRVVIWNGSYATTAAAGTITAGDLNNIADAVHDETMSDHLSPGTTGAKLNQSDRTGR